MTIRFQDLFNAFEFVSYVDIAENAVFVDIKTEKIHYFMKMMGNYQQHYIDQLDHRYCFRVPHNNELNLGKVLALQFCQEKKIQLQQHLLEISDEEKFHSELDRVLQALSMNDEWCNYKRAAQQNALKQWCQGKTIAISEES